MPKLRDSADLFARRFALALRRATRLDPGAPLDAPTDPDDALVRASTRHLPGAAWAIGLLSAFVFALVALLLRATPWATAVAAVASAIAATLLTGARQESAVFRFAEGFEPRTNGARGSAGYGVITMVLLLGLRLAAVAALGSVTPGGVLAALFAGPVVSRFAALLAAYWLNHGAGIDRPTLRIAALWCVPPLLLMALANGFVFALVALAGAVIAWVAMLRFFRRRPGAFDDLRSASLQQACEAAFYVASSLGA